MISSKVEAFVPSEQASLIICKGYVPKKIITHGYQILGLFLQEYMDFPSLSDVFAHFTVRG